MCLAHRQPLGNAIICLYERLHTALTDTCPLWDLKDNETYGRAHGVRLSRAVLLSQSSRFLSLDPPL